MSAPFVVPDLLEERGNAREVGWHLRPTSAGSAASAGARPGTASNEHPVEGRAEALVQRRHEEDRSRVRARGHPALRVRARACCICCRHWGMQPRAVSRSCRIPAPASSVVIAVSASFSQHALEARKLVGYLCGGGPEGRHPGSRRRIVGQGEQSQRGELRPARPPGVARHGRLPVASSIELAEVRHEAIPQGGVGDPAIALCRLDQ